MKLFAVALIVAAALADTAAAHYRFYKAISGSTTYPEYQYIRKNTNTNSPVTDVTSTDFRCNVGGQNSATTTDTLTVNAGSTLGFESDIAVFHPGSFNIYMAKAPSTAASYDGSGANWFRVWQKGATSITSSAINFDITSTRFIHFYYPKQSSERRFYISCAQIKVQNGGSGRPSPKVSIPGVYTGNEPGNLINIYWPIPISYTTPGPAIWP